MNSLHRQEKLDRLIAEYAPLRAVAVSLTQDMPLLAALRKSVPVQVLPKSFIQLYKRNRIRYNSDKAEFGR